jgi:hypothetical protein
LVGAAPTGSTAKEKKEKPLRVLPNKGNALNQADGALQTATGPAVATTAGFNFAGVGSGDYGFAPNAAPAGSRWPRRWPRATRTRWPSPAMTTTKCTAFSLKPEQLRYSGIPWIDRQRVALIRLQRRINLGHWPAEDEVAHTPHQFLPTSGKWMLNGGALITTTLRSWILTCAEDVSSPRKIKFEVL